MPSREWIRLNEGIRETIASHQLEVPVKLGTIAKALGIGLRASTLPAGISGEIRPTDNRTSFVVRVNRHDGARRQRFTIAHEIAHYLLHRDHIGAGIKDDALYRSSLSDTREAEANRLASDILMPDHLITAELASARAQGVEDIVAEMADRFEVSEAAMKIRLGIG